MDLLPVGNSGYSTQSYWNDRYSREDPSASFDWLKKYSEIQHLVHQFVPDKRSRIVMLGCGNSTLSKDLYDDGYTSIVNIDYSPVVIAKMAAQYADRPGMTWLEADITALPFEAGSFDVAIDKCTMDGLMTTAKGDIWDPPPQVIEACRSEVDEVTRVLSPTGVFLYLSFGQPHFRKRHLLRPGWELIVTELGEGFTYYLYSLLRLPSP